MICPRHQQVLLRQHICGWMKSENLSSEPAEAEGTVISAVDLGYLGSST